MTQLQPETPWASHQLNLNLTIVRTPGFSCRYQGLIFHLKWVSVEGLISHLKWVNLWLGVSSGFLSEISCEVGVSGYVGVPLEHHLCLIFYLKWVSSEMGVS
jgi:hypothetical protein